MYKKKNNALQRIKLFFYKKEGATALEFALIAPVFFLLLMGTIELGLIFFAESVLQGALMHGARVSKTGYSEGERTAYVRSEIIRLSGFILDPEKLVIEPMHYNSHANIGQPEPCITTVCESGLPNVDYADINSNGQWDADQGTAGLGIRNDIVIFRGTYEWPLFTPLIKHFFNDDDKVVLTSTAIVKNEAF